MDKGTENLVRDGIRALQAGADALVRIARAAESVAKSQERIANPPLDRFRVLTEEETVEADEAYEDSDESYGGTD